VSSVSKDFNDPNVGLSNESIVPLYIQLITLIKRQSLSGVLKPGDLVPSETSFCSQYEVSRSTVRQALLQLTEEGLIIRRRGKGSFIASEKLNRNLNYLYSFTEDMDSLNLHPRSEILEKSTINASNEIAERLNLNKNNLKVFKLKRLRIANEEPLLLETTYIPLYLCPDIVNEDFVSKSLYSIFRNKYNLDLFKAVETYEAVKTTKETSDLLRCSSGDPAFNIKRTAYLDSGIAFEFTSSITRSDKCIFTVELYTNKNKINFTRTLSF